MSTSALLHLLQIYLVARFLLDVTSGVKHNTHLQVLQCIKRLVKIIGPNSGSNKYYSNGVLLTNYVNVLDLGITISADLSYNAHINNIVARELQRSSTLYRGFASAYNWL
jgi:hypothetical protein